MHILGCHFDWYDGNDKKKVALPLDWSKYGRLADNRNLLFTYGPNPCGVYRAGRWVPVREPTSEVRFAPRQQRHTASTEFIVFSERQMCSNQINVGFIPGYPTFRHGYRQVD